MNQNPLDFGYVFSTPDEIWGPYSTIFFIVFTLGTIISNFVFFYFKYRFKNNLLTYTLVNRASRNASIAFSLGFFFFLSRIAKLQPFNARVFLDVALLLLVYYTIRGVLYMLKTYPKAKAEWQTQQARQVRKTEPRATVGAGAPIRPATPAKVATTASVARGSVDTSTIQAGTTSAEPTAAEIRQGLSERALKRRERKRNKR
ncbi:MAG: hypothetical protein JWP00_3075 [Chloroflexi bacterium]|jgi:hypothetical protein|nr:hypothetical protein [Chloroflexota bacterium]